MKKQILFLLNVLCMVSCRKLMDSPFQSVRFIENIKIQLDDSLNTSIKDSLDYSGVILTRYNNESSSFLRIPLKEISMERRFVLLRLGANGKVLEGRLVVIDRDMPSIQQSADVNATVTDELSAKDKLGSQFNGHIEIQYLNGRKCLVSSIAFGYIEQLHRYDEISLKSMEDIDVWPIRPIAYKVLPEIVITASSVGGGGYSYASWYSLGSMFYGSGSSGAGISYVGNGSGISGYYSLSGGSSSRPTDGNSKGYTTKDNYVREDKTILIDFELPPDKVVDINSYLNCFGLLPDAGTSCSIELFTDIPVDEKPMAGFNPKTYSPGHTFIQITKEGNGQRVSQNIGFYPASQAKTLLTTAPQDGVFADNEGHEFNASIKMHITAEQLKVVIDQIKTQASHPKYDIDDYNCTDFALQIFNSVRGMNPLEIPKLDIPETMNPFGSNTPQGVYLKLKEMKSANSNEAANITLPGVKGYVGNSHGSCN